MNKRILNLVKQMSQRDKEDLFKHIRSNYTLKEKDGMLRDDIRDKVFELMYTEFPYIEDIQEHYQLKYMHLDVEDLVNFSSTLIREFELEDIEFATIKEWVTIADMIQTVDELMQDKIYISGFEPEE